MFPYDEPFDLRGSVIRLQGAGALRASFVRPTVIRDVDLRTSPNSSLGTAVQLFDSALDFAGGSVSFLEIWDGSSCCVSGGSLSSFVINGSVVDVVGDARISGMTINAGSIGLIRDGYVERLSVSAGASCEIVGGRVELLQTLSGSSVIIEAADLMLSGVPIETVPQPVDQDDIFSATLADGSILIVAPAMVTGQLEAETTEIRPAALGPPEQALLFATGVVDRPGLRPTERLAAEDATFPDGFRMVSAELSATDSVIGDGFFAAFSEHTFTDVEVGMGARVAHGAWIQNGGSIGRSFRAGEGARVTLNDVTIGSNVDVIDAAQFQASGCSVVDLDITAAEVVLTDCDAFGDISVRGESSALIQGIEADGLGVSNDAEIYGVVVAGLGVSGGEQTLDASEIGRVSIGTGGHLRVLSSSWSQEPFLGNGGVLELRVSRAALDGAPMFLARGESRIVDQTAADQLSGTFSNGQEFTVGLGTNVQGGTVMVTRLACACEFGGDPQRIEIIDLLNFLDLWLAGDPQADFTLNGVDVLDLLEFLECWIPNRGLSCE